VRTDVRFAISNVDGWHGYEHVGRVCASAVVAATSQLGPANELTRRIRCKAAAAGVPRRAPACEDMEVERELKIGTTRPRATVRGQR
jgi:hypothetical protein